jgi:hypothetical protein
MKIPFRVPGLAAALACAALSAAPAATTITCHTTCVKNLSMTTVVWTTSQADCCSTTVNPCPAGYRKASSWYSAVGVPSTFCPTP